MRLRLVFAGLPESQSHNRKHVGTDVSAQNWGNGIFTNERLRMAIIRTIQGIPCSDCCAQGNAAFCVRARCSVASWRVKISRRLVVSRFRIQHTFILIESIIVFRSNVIYLCLPSYCCLDVRRARLHLQESFAICVAWPLPLL